MTAIYWTCDTETRIRICNYFHIGKTVNVNGMTFIDADEGTLQRLRDGEKKGFFKIRYLI